MAEIFQILQNLPAHLQVWALAFGPWFYLVLAVVLFAETGLVVTPFLPGDSLLFAAGACAGLGLPNLHFSEMAGVCAAAVFCGDMVNYHVGLWLGPKLFHDSRSQRWLNKRHLQKTHDFYERHGGKTIILARFVPIVRTYTPFVAGIGRMRLRRFASFSACAALLWILLFLGLGYFFGNIPEVKANFHLVIVAIIFISVIPIGIEMLKAKRAKSGDVGVES